MITNPVFTNQSESGNGQEPTNIQRRTLIGGALAALFSSSVRVMAKENDEQPNDPFIVLLKGLYQPVGAGQGPPNNLGLSTVNLSDGTYSRTRIYLSSEFRKTGTRTGLSATSTFNSQGICVLTAFPEARL
jgi:hypothetical protein